MISNIVYFFYRFANDELESLFDRYLLKVQHGSLSATVGLFIVLTAILSGLSFGLLAMPTVENMFYSIHCLVFVILLILLATKALEDTHLTYVNYVVLFFAATFVVVGLPVSFDLSQPDGKAGGMSIKLRIIIIECTSVASLEWVLSMAMGASASKILRKKIIAPTRIIIIESISVASLEWVLWPRVLKHPKF